MTEVTRTYDVTIKGLDKKGSGTATIRREEITGRNKNLKVSVPETLVGEEVRVTVPNALGRRRANILPDEILKPHPERVGPECPHFELCGGCVWQHFSYEGQLKEKYNSIVKFLEQHDFDISVVNPVIGMNEDPWHYRNKMEFTFGKNGELGLHELGNFRNVIDLETCLIAGKNMTAAMLIVSEWAKRHELPGYNKDTNVGLMRHLMIRESQITGEMMIALFTTDDRENHKEILDELIETLTTQLPHIESIMWMKNTDIADRAQSEDTTTLYGRDFIYDVMSGYKYRVWFDTFFQTNPVQAQKLVELAIEMADANEDMKMIDLFCGVGTFSLPFASRVKELAGIEIVESSIESAKRNARDNDIDNTYFLAQDARRGMDKVLEEWGTPDLVLLDPPRSGAGGKVMRRIGRLQTEKVVYVSCNPETFAEDIVWLRDFGYELKTVQPVDLFPHTVHCEIVALLSRVDKKD